MVNDCSIRVFDYYIVCYGGLEVAPSENSEIRNPCDNIRYPRAMSSDIQYIDIWDDIDRGIDFNRDVSSAGEDGISECFKIGILYSLRDSQNRPPR